MNKSEKNPLWDIINFARTRIKFYIAFDIYLLYKAFGYENPNFEEGEDWEITDEELVREVTIGVVVTNTDGTDSIEYRHVTKVKVTLDENIFVETEGDDTEIEWERISTDELVDLAGAIQETYFQKIRKK